MFLPRKLYKKNSQKYIFYKQTQLKLSPTKMELCGGENRYREGRLIDVWLPTLKLYILTILRAKVLRAKALRPCQLNLTVWRSKCQN